MKRRKIAKGPVQLRIGFDEKLVVRILACGAALSAHKAVTSKVLKPGPKSTPQRIGAIDASS